MIRTSLMSAEQFAEFVKTHPVAGGKGDEAAQNAENSQASFTKTLQQVFANNNQKQQEQLNFLTNQLQEAVNNPQGYSPQTLASMRTQAEDAAATNNANVEQAVNEKFATTGGASPTALPNGVQEQIQAGVANSEAQNEANQQLGITEQQGQLQLQEKQNAERELGQVAEEENPEGMASGATGAAESIGGLSQAVTASAGPTFGSILGGVVGAGLGAAGQAGGFSNLLKV